MMKTNNRDTEGRPRQRIVRHSDLPGLDELRVLQMSVNINR